MVRQRPRRDVETANLALSCGWLLGGNWEGEYRMCFWRSGREPTHGHQASWRWVCVKSSKAGRREWCVGPSSIQALLVCLLSQYRCRESKGGKVRGDEGEKKSQIFKGEIRIKKRNDEGVDRMGGRRVGGEQGVVWIPGRRGKSVWV